MHPKLIATLGFNAFTVSVSYLSQVEQGLRIALVLLSIFVTLVQFFRRRPPSSTPPQGRVPKVSRVPRRLPSHLPCLVRPLLLLPLCFLLWGCAQNAGQLARQDDFLAGATNSLATLRPAAQLLPPPYNAAVDTGLIAAIVALTTWNTINHRRISKLQQSLPVPGA